ncbi:MAG: outer membrane protein [Xanthobacteraceae bacterium]
MLAVSPSVGLRRRRPRERDAGHCCTVESRRRRATPASTPGTLRFICATPGLKSQIRKCSKTWNAVFIAHRMRDGAIMTNARLMFSAVVALHALLATGAASGADLAAPPQPYVKAPVMIEPVASWTGCYGGVNIGTGWQGVHPTDPLTAPFPFDLGSDNGVGVVGGGQVGCDYQFASNWVVGIQGMFDGAGVTSSHIVPFAYGLDNTETLTSKTGWFATLTGRIGYTVLPQGLLYFKGGAAWVNTRYSDVDPTPVLYTPFSGQASATRAGWTVGGGGEYAFLPNWSVFAEYDYTGLGTRGTAFTYNCGAGCGFSNPYYFSEKQSLQTVLVGLNYRFGAGR